MTLLLMAASATVGALFGALAVGIAALSAGRCRHCDEDVPYTVESVQIDGDILAKAINREV